MIEFILNNLFIIIAVLLFLFGRLGSNANKRARRAAEQPTGYDPSPYAEPDDETPVWNKTTNEQSKRKDHSPVFPWENELEVIEIPPAIVEPPRESRTEAAPFAPSVRTQGIQGDHEPVSSSEAPEAFSGFHATQAAQGMMWAEIFGKPRALQPHASLRSRGRRPFSK